MSTKITTQPTTTPSSKRSSVMTITIPTNFLKAPASSKVKRRLSGLFSPSSKQAKRQEKAVGTEEFSEIFSSEEEGGQYVVLVSGKVSTDASTTTSGTAVTTPTSPHAPPPSIDTKLRLDVPFPTPLTAEKLLSVSSIDPKSVPSLSASTTTSASSTALLSPVSSDASSILFPSSVPLASAASMTDPTTQMQVLCRLRASYAASHQRNLAMLEEKMSWLQARKTLEAEVNRLRKERDEWIRERDEVAGVREMVEGMCKEMDEEAGRAERELEEMRLIVDREDDSP